MRATKAAKRRIPSAAMTVELPEDFDVLSAIALPKILKQIPRSIAVTLDFRRVHRLSRRALAALIPALAGVKDRLLFSEGLPPDEQGLLQRVGIGPAAVVSG